MKIALGSDHAGFKHTEAILEELKRLGHEVEIFGAEDESPPTDYPDPARQVAECVADGTCERGILVCGTGIGMSIVANKVPGIRAATVHDEYTTIMSRAHNDANVLCLGARVVDAGLALSLTGLWLKTGYEGGRHKKRLAKIKKIESECAK